MFCKAVKSNSNWFLVISKMETKERKNTFFSTNSLALNILIILSVLGQCQWKLIKKIIYLQSAKILLVPKCEIIMGPSNYSFFQYCDRNIELFSIAPCKVITLNLSLLLFWIVLSKVIALPTIGIAIVVALSRS